MSNEHLHLKEGVGPCEIHDWGEERIRREFVKTLRERHRKGGLNVCRECIDNKLSPILQKIKERITKRKQG